MPTRKSVRLIDHSTPENARIVSVPFRNMRKSDSVMVTKVRTSSAMRWSGLVSSPSLAQPEVGAVGEIEMDEPPGEPVAPQEAEALLAEAEEHGDRGRGAEDADVEERLVHEPGVVAVLDRGQFVSI